MADDPKKRGPADSKRINLEQEHELAYWTEELEATPTRLREAVRAVGPMAHAVRAYLGKKGRSASRGGKSTISNGTA